VTAVPARVGTGVCVVAAVVNTVFILAQQEAFSLKTLAERGWPVITLAALASGVMGSLVLSRRPRHPIGRLLVFGGMTAALSLALDAYATWILLGDGSGPRTVALVASWLASALNGPITLAAFALILLLAPDGHLAGPRWRAAAVVAVVGGTLMQLPPFLEPVEYSGTDPHPVGVVARTADTVGALLLVTAFAAAVVSLVRRQARATGGERVQIRWFTTAAAALVATWVWLLATQRFFQVTAYAVSIVPLFAAVLAFPVAIAVAVLRYRLYDIDLIVNRAWLLVGATLFVGLAYVAVVTLIGTSVVGFWPSLLTTVLVALAFQPVRLRIVRLADRLAYGAQAAPYLALADLSRRLGASPSPGTLLRSVAEACAGATAARGARVELCGHDGSVLADATVPEGHVLDPTTTVRLHVRDGGETLGALYVDAAPGRALRRRDLLVLAGFSEQAGVAFRNLRLDDELAGRVAELSVVAAELDASRRRLLAVRDDELARLERALTSDVAPRLARASADLTALADADAPPDDARWDAIAAELGAGLQEIRDLSHGLRPGLLDAEGLGPALQAHLRRRGRTVLHLARTARGRRFEPALEAAVYACVVDAERALHLERCTLDLDDAGHLLLCLVGSADGPGAAGLAARLRDRVEGRGGSVGERRVDTVAMWLLDLPTTDGHPAGAASREAGPGRQVHPLPELAPGQDVPEGDDGDERVERDEEPGGLLHRRPRVSWPRRDGRVRLRGQ
jgi:signal transduction histidine kinase